QQTLQQNTNGSLHPSEALALNTLQALARADSSTALVAAPGSGKSVTLNYLIQKILADSPMADIWVISAKNDSFCGLREKERVIVFEQENPDLAKEVIDSFYTD
ncbi:MAG: type IV secretory system conjugative DNA transfer family protein, partial [Nostoc sp.]